MFNQPQTGAKSRVRANARLANRWSGLLAIVLLLFVALLQATHAHGNGLQHRNTAVQVDHATESDQDGAACALCSALHSLLGSAPAVPGTPVTFTAATLRARPEQGVATPMHFRAFGRPPPLFV